MQQALEVVWPLLALAEREQNVDHIVGACRALGSNLFHAGELQLARQYQERAIALYDRQQHQWSHIFHYGADSAIICQATLTLTLWLLGYPDQALACSEKTLALAEELAHPFSQTFALIYIAWFHQLRRARPDAQRCAVAGLALGSQHNFKGFSGMGAIIYGWALVDQGQVRAGIQQIEHGVDVWASTGGYVAIPLWRSLLAEAYGKDGRAAQGLALLPEALADLEQRGERRCETEIHLVQAALLEQQAALPREVEAVLQRALLAARNKEAKALELRAAIRLGRLWRQQGKVTQARELLAPLYAWFTEGFATPDLQEARALLALLG